MSDSRGSPPPGYHPNLHFSPNESEIPIFGVDTTNDSVFNSYMPPDDISVIRHHDTRGIQLNQEHVIPGPSRMDYPEPSRQPDIHRIGHQFSTYTFAGGPSLADSQSTSTRLPDPRLETISGIPSTNYNRLQYLPDRFPSYPGPSGSPASPHHRDVPNLREPHMGTVHPPYPNETSAAQLSLSQPRRRGPPDRDEFQMLPQPPSNPRAELEGFRRGPYRLPSADVESSRFNPMSTPHIPSVSSIPISNPDWSRAFPSAPSRSTLELDHATRSSGSPPTIIAHSSSKSSAAQSTAKKKKSKMHPCDIPGCGKSFPRYESVIHFCFAFTQWTTA